jgi:hypothetical protein
MRTQPLQRPIVVVPNVANALAVLLRDLSQAIPLKEMEFQRLSLI